MQLQAERFLSAAGRGTEFGLVGDITDWITDTARRPTRVLAWGLETDFYGSQLLIHKLDDRFHETSIHGTMSLLADSSFVLD